MTKKKVQPVIDKLEQIIEQSKQSKQIIIPNICPHCQNINTKIRSSIIMPETPLFVPELAKTYQGRKVNYCRCNQCGEPFTTNQPVGAEC